ncbi:MAG: serine/threonine protein kinase [Chloroflexi bacterium]|nr:serine/threonine protein kinase [Chloroflexota bacterium]
MNDPLIGRQVANFRIERVLGRGGMAQVYYGRDVKLQRPVAVKVIDASFRGNPAYARRFVQEARTIATWRHENIVQIYYADNESDLYYFVMEYLDGLDLAGLLARYLRNGELMPLEDVIRIGRAIASALDYAHQKGVVHRDVKPSNVMVATDDRIVLMDFGLALDSHQGTMGEVFGTPHYIAPEQARNSSNAVPQSDLYSLGIILYEMLTGTVPYDDPSPTAVALQHLTLPLPPPRERNPALNIETEAVLIKALSKSPADRYQKGYELMDALEKAVSAHSFASPIELPPLPAGMEFRPQTSLSQVSVADWLARHTQETQTSTAYPIPGLPPTRRSLQTSEVSRQAPPPNMASSSKKWGWLIGASLASVLIVGLAIAGFVLLSGDGNEDKQNVGATATVEPSITATIGVLVPQDAATSIPTLTASPTEAISVAGIQTVATSSPTPTLTATATSTNSPIPTAPASLTPTIEQISVSAVPTIKYPNGRRVILLYNADSFYILNVSGGSLQAASFGFERILNEGNFLNRFYGNQLARFYPTLDSNYCARMEILQRTGYLRPSDCRGYNSSITPQAQDSFVFWTPDPRSMQFRVLWNEEEIARCEISAERCEVYLP